jgi:Domain of unknown function (DUF4157)/Transglycosylase SLT domain
MRTLAPKAARLSTANGPLTRQSPAAVPLLPASSVSSPAAFDFSTVPPHRPRLTIQPKLTVGAKGDAYEQEADRVADQVMRTPEPDARVSHPKSAPVRLQTKSGHSGGKDEIAAPPVVHEVLDSPGRPLDSAARSFMEPRFGCDFSQVRVHNDGAAAQAANAMRANAFTSGRHIVFRDGAASGPQSRHLLAHELAHVVQQRRSATALLQRDAIDDNVKKVTSPTLDNARAQTADIDTQLHKRLAKRAKEINDKLANLNKDPSANAAKIKEMNAALAKPVKDIIDKTQADPASKGVRDDIIASAKQLESDKKREGAIDAKWSEHDAVFSGPEVRAALGSNTITPADLKAMIAQESGDLMNYKTGLSGRSGMAQLSPKEEKEFGAKPGDRDIPQKAIVLAAKAVAKKAADLDRLLTNKPTGVERRKFIMGAYNAGEHTISDAQDFAIQDRKKGDTWDELIAGGDASPMHRAVAKRLSGGQTKQGEVRKYPNEIFDRLKNVP